MKVCIVQPYYSFDAADLDRCFNEMVDLIAQCDASMDVIVLPEYCDVPAATPDKAAFDASIETYNAKIEEIARQTAIRCNAIVFANYGYPTEHGYRNTTHAFDRTGAIVGRYFKAHPAPSEVKDASQGGNGMDVTYSYEYRTPYVIEIEGVRYGFMTCYDFYFYEAFAAVARQKVDVIIGTSHQRTDTHNALDMIGRFLSYHTNAYLVRSAVSLGEDSPICGCSMVVSPDGTMLADMKSKIGLTTVEIDPKAKYYKPAGFLGKPKSHYEYIDEGRRPWLYRPAGPAMIAPDAYLPYPRVCSHRGFNTVAPENSLPAYGAAIALGAQEIEFDLWLTADGHLVTMHDPTLESHSDGKGYVWDYTLAQLQAFDFGAKSATPYHGLRVLLFEDILKKFSCQTIMNIHVKDRHCEGYGETDTGLREEAQKIADLLYQYDCEQHVYIMSSNPEFMQEFHRIAPNVRRCMGWRAERPWGIVDDAIELGCEKVQFYTTYITKEEVERAHAHGIVCNAFFADTIEDAKRYLDMGIDTILTNDYLTIANTVKAHCKK